MNIVYNDQLDLEAFRAWRPEYATADFILEDGKYICGWAVEKMSKSMYNVVNPDMIVERYGADTLRLYEMFLGPLEQSNALGTLMVSTAYTASSASCGGCTILPTAYVSLTHPLPRKNSKAYTS